MLQEVVGGVRYGPLFQQLQGANNDDVNRSRARIALQILAEKRERLRIPVLVIGFKVSDPAKIAAQLKRLDPLLADALKDTPLKGRSERIKIESDEFPHLEARWFADSLGQPAARICSRISRGSMLR